METVRQYLLSYIEHGSGIDTVARKLEISRQTLKKFLDGEGVSLKVNYKLLDWYKRRPV